MQSTLGAPEHHSNIIFPNLPLGLRELIYAYLVPDVQGATGQNIRTTGANAIYSQDPRFPYWLSTVCRVNEGTRIGFALYILRTSLFSIICYKKHQVAPRIPYHHP